MTARRPRIAILGAGMAGLAAAWRLSEPGWQQELESITVYQRGWRLGGKGASSRGVNGRIEEHGLHLWLGYYQNAFRLLRECYAELDRETTDPSAPIRTWREAMLPVGMVGLEDRRPDGWHHWLGQFSRNDLEPGATESGEGMLSVAYVFQRVVQLITDFIESLPEERLAPGVLAMSGSSDPPRSSSVLRGVRVGVLAAILEASAQLRGILDRGSVGSSVATLDGALTAIEEALRGIAEEDAEVRRTWHLIAVFTATLRGLLADGIVTDERGLRALNDEDFLDWIGRHGAPGELADFAFVRGLYDLAFSEVGARRRSRRGVSAGIAVFLTTKMFVEYRGAIFWKMAAGMGDVVFAPLYEALSRRGVTFEFFHRVDHLHLSTDRTSVAAVSLGRQVDLMQGREHYEPLVRFGGLPCFPDAPLVDQLQAGAGIEGQPLESHFCDWPDAETRVLRNGADFDVLVLAVSLGMVPLVCSELIEDRREWRAMVEHVKTTATQAVQVWLREDERTLGWPHRGTTVSAYEQPLHTWASMEQLIDVECWPAAERPGAIAYFCGSLRAPAPPEGDWHAYVAEQRAGVRANAIELLDRSLAHLLPGSSRDGSFRWELLCGRNGHSGPGAIDSQFFLANVDPSDLYVQCAPGSDKHRLRAEESGYDNLVLAGDWIDNGLNAGCIEAATISGLQAANAVLGRSRSYGISGLLLS